MEQKMELKGGGTLTLRREGGRVRLTAERRQDGLGLYKVWLRGRGEGKLLLGTLAPEGDSLRLTRTLSLNELEHRSCWPVETGEAVLAVPFAEKSGWRCEKNPGRLVRDEALSCELTKPMLCNEEKDNFHLACRFRPSEPLQAETIATLASLSEIGETPYLVWEFRRDGTLIVPKEQGEI